MNVERFEWEESVLGTNESISPESTFTSVKDKIGGASIIFPLIAAVEQKLSLLTGCGAFLLDSSSHQ